MSWMPLNSSLSNVPSYSCSLIRRPPLVLPCVGFEGVFWSWSRADEQRVGVLIRRPRFFCWRVMPLRGGWEACVQGEVLLVIFNSSSSRRQCDGGGRSGLFSLCNSSYSLWCPLWPLASGLWPLASGQRRLISGTCSYYWRRRIQYTSRLVFAFFDSITEGRRSPSLSATSKHTWIT